MRIEFQWQSCNYSATVRPVAVSGHIRPIETIGCALFAFLSVSKALNLVHYIYQSAIIYEFTIFILFLMFMPF